VGRDRQRGLPRYPPLHCAGRSLDRSDDRIRLRRSKVFPSLAGSRLSTAPCFGRHSLDPVTRGSTDVSAHRDFRSAPQSGGYGALIMLAPSTEMSRITLSGIYTPVIQTSRLEAANISFPHDRQLEAVMSPRPRAVRSPGPSPAGWPPAGSRRVAGITSPAGPFRRTDGR